MPSQAVVAAGVAPCARAPTVRAYFFVTAPSDPGLLPRLIEPVAKLGAVPSRVHAGSLCVHQHLLPATRTLKSDVCDHVPNSGLFLSRRSHSGQSQILAFLIGFAPEKSARNSCFTPANPL